MLIFYKKTNFKCEQNRANAFTTKNKLCVVFLPGVGMNNITKYLGITIGSKLFKKPQAPLQNQTSKWPGPSQYLTHFESDFK